MKAEGIEDFVTREGRRQKDVEQAFTALVWCPASKLVLEITKSQINLEGQNYRLMIIGFRDRDVLLFEKNTYYLYDSRIVMWKSSKVTNSEIKANQIVEIIYVIK